MERRRGPRPSLGFRPRPCGGSSTTPMVEVRRAGGARTFEEVMTFPAPPPVTPYYAAGILDFVFGELWQRPELDRRGRRWVTLVGVADSSARIPIRTHLYAALATGDASEAELGEFVLQYAVHGGWPRASALQAEALDVARLVREGKPYAD
ncbi:MAG: hypothetical protein KatS3mg124_0152 [Porticoccaceae bacterium]|nr:MAG: hypothetical protein KatS3mg124_0152 [Porticoccaceae bacterium]